MITKFKLFESPDNLIYNGKRYSSKSEDSVSFCVLAKHIDDNYYTVYVDNVKGQGHADMEYTPIPGEPEPKFKSFYFNTFYGRLWLNDKLISFWDIPKIGEDFDIKAFRYYMNELKRKLIKRGFISENEDMNNWIMQIDNMIFIKVKDFIGDFKSNEEDYKYHLMRSDDIRRKNRSKKYFGNTNDSKPLKWKQALLRSEALNISKINGKNSMTLNISNYKDYQIPAVLVMMSSNFKVVEEKLNIDDYIVYPVTINYEDSHYIPAQVVDRFYNYKSTYYIILDINGNKETLSYYKRLYKIVNKEILEEVKEKIDLIKDINKYNI